MDARLTAEQRRMQETVREFVRSKGGIEIARRFMAGDGGEFDELWEELAELDLCAVSVPIEYQGLGDGMVSTVAILEELGRYAVPGPYPETVAFAVPLISEHGTEAQKDASLAGIANGNRSVSFAVHDDGSEPVPATIEGRTVGADEPFRLSGTKTLVPYGEQVDSLIVAVRTEAGTTGYEGISLYLVDTDDVVETRQLESLDRTRPVYEVSFEDVPVDDGARIGPQHSGGDLLLAATQRYNLATSAMLVGAADRAVDASSDYANEREQYGQPIGKFQAVKHRIVDMWVDMQAARSLVYYAAWALDDDAPEAARLLPATKRYVANRLHRVFRDDIWNHGGMGFTWEHDAHIYLKQAEAWRNVFGTPQTSSDHLVDARLDSSGLHRE